MRSSRRFLAVLAACLFLVALPLGGGALGATSSGANGDIAYVESGSILLLSGGTVATGVDPSWSPDGTKLAFAATTGGAIETCVVSIPCTPAQVGTATGSGPVWSPDGSKIAYVNAAGTSIHYLTFPGGGSDTTFVSGTDPSWSPDGAQLAYSSGGSIFTCTFAGPCGSPTQLVASGTQPAWSPDGQTIAYQSGTNVDVIAAAGGSAHFVGIGTSPQWSPNGDSLVFVNTSGQIVVVQGSGSSWGSESARTTGTPADSTPDWQTVAPVRGSAPSIFGTAQTGSLLSATNGTWTGASANGYTYAWQRCDSAGNNCAAIGGATSATYAPVGADVGKRLRVVVTASNPAGSTVSLQSNATAVVTQAGVVNPPVNTAYPSISLGLGQTVPLIGSFVTASTGTWSGSFPMTFAYQWKWCDTPFSSCFDIIGATSSFYTVPAIYYGKVLRVQVTSTNSAASVAQNSEASPAVSAIAPFLRITPQIAGQNIVDQTLSLTAGTWDGSPAPTFTYSWRRCNPPGDLTSCVQIPGATTATYTPAVVDIGFTIRVWITGSNPAGSALAITNHTYPVVDKQHFAPTTQTAPSITGVPVVGGQLTAGSSSFDGDVPITTNLAWQRCDATGAACHTIAAATKTAYSPTLADVGSTLRLAVTAKNAYGSIIALSDPTDPVQGLPPHRKGRRIVGTAKLHYLLGTPYDDVLIGGPGNETIDGGGGYDTIRAGSGNDVITVRGPGSSRIYGGRGSSTIYAANGYKDYIYCVGGHDKVIADAFDVVKNCKVVQGPAGSTAPAPPAPTTPGPR